MPKKNRRDPRAKVPKLKWREVGKTKKLNKTGKYKTSRRLKVWA
jgi:hypothetical protein